MTNTAENCRVCGTALSQQLPGQCPTCLMNQAMQPGESELCDANDPALNPTFVPAEPNVSEGVSPKPATELKPDDQFGDYRIVRRLGRGGMGVVYEADHLPSSRRVALKILSHSLDSKEARSRFLREGRLAAAINHQNSVYVFGTEEVEGVPTISMELIPGGTLAAKVQKLGPMSVEEVVDVILQVIAGLEAAEEKGVLHRDIKPANCFIDQHGTVKIGDFGLSVSTASTDFMSISNVTQEGVFLGTPAFASPEQLRGEQLDQRSDIYALGVTLFYLLTGKVPFEGKNMIQLLASVLDKTPPAIRELRDDIPESLARVVGSCLAKSAGSRPQNYADLRERLSAFQVASSTTATLGQRFVAGLVDVFVVGVLVAVLKLAGSWFGTDDEGPTPMRWTVIQLAVSFCYFTVLERKTGASIGKYILGIRVVQQGHSIPWLASAARAALVEVVPFVPRFIGDVVVRYKLGESPDSFAPENSEYMLSMIGLSYAVYVLRAMLFIPAVRSRTRTAVHDRWTNTSVVQVEVREPVAEVQQREDRFSEIDTAELCGPFHILETLAEDEDGTTLLGYDPKLLRRVWIRRYSISVPPISETERNLARGTRLRWLGGHRSEVDNWDCYEAPEGHGLLRHYDRDWANTRQLIWQLAEELDRSVSEKGLPPALGYQNLWIEGRSIKLLPFAAPDVPVKQFELVTGTSAEQQQATCTEFVSRFADYLVYAGEEFVPVPVSSRETLTSIRQTTSTAECRRLAEKMLVGPATVTRSRRVSLLLVTFAIPVFMFASGVFGSLRYWATADLYDAYAELSQDATVMNLLERRDQDSEEKIVAMRTYISGTYRKEFDNKRLWNSGMAIIGGPRNRELLAEIMENVPIPTAEQLTEVTELRTQIADELNLPKVQTSVGGPLSGTMLNMMYWAIVVWLPGLVAGMLFRGGLLLRSFGVAVVNRRGIPVGGLQLGLRWCLTGLPFFLALFIAHFEQTSGGMFFFPTSPGSYMSLLFAQVTNITFSIVGGGLLIWSACRPRFLSDSLSGCYLVPQ